MKRKWVLILLFITITLATACTQITDIIDPNNTYTPEITYQKLIGEYPFIKIAKRDVPASVIEIKNLTYVI